jgi:hypothetical protein
MTEDASRQPRHVHPDPPDGPPPVLGEPRGDRRRHLQEEHLDRVAEFAALLTPGRRRIWLVLRPKHQRQVTGLRVIRIRPHHVAAVIAAILVCWYLIVVLS